MNNPAWYRGWRKAVRTLLQLAAGGALTAAVNALANGLSPNTKVYVLTAWTVLISLAQNAFETSGRIPALLPTPGLVPSTGQLATQTVGTVETAIDTVGGAVGDIAGTVTDVTGTLLGEVIPPGED